MLVSTQQLWHGGEEQAALLIEGLAERGHTVRLMARRRSAFAQRMQSLGYAVTTFKGRGRMPQVVWQIRRQLARWRPDLLFCNDPHSLTSAGMASLGLGIPLRIAARRVDFPIKSPLRYQYLCDHVICVSKAVGEICRQSGIAPERLSVVHDGVDPRRILQGQRQRGRDAIGVSSNEIVLLTVAKLTDHKGHRFMMEAMPAVLEKYPSVVWVVAGDGPLRDALQRHAVQLGVAPRVRFLGHRSDVPDLLAAADRMVVPSHMEGLCSSVVDAMLAGLPVVATRAGGIPDLLDARGALQSAVGWLVPPCQPAELAKAIVHSISFPHYTRQRALNARVRAEAEFTAAHMVEQTLAIVQRLLAAGSTRWGKAA